MPTRDASRDSVITLAISSISRIRGVNPRVSRFSIYLISVFSSSSVNQADLGRVSYLTCVPAILLRKVVSGTLYIIVAARRVK